MIRATSRYLNEEPRDWLAVWHARLARELCPQCLGKGYRNRRHGQVEIIEPCHCMKEKVDG